EERQDLARVAQRALRGGAPGLRSLPRRRSRERQREILRRARGRLRAPLAWRRRGRGSAFRAGGEQAFELALELLLGAGDGVALFVEQLLDAPDDFDLAVGVHALARLALGRVQARELGLPVAQDVGLDVERLAGFADLVIELRRPFHLVLFP